MKICSVLLWKTAAIAMALAIAPGWIGSSVSQAASIAYYTFDENVNDQDGIGVANNLNLNGSTLTTGSLGMFGEALSNDPVNTGTLGVAAIPDTSAGSFDTTFGTFSLGLWVKADLAHTGVLPATTNSSSRFFITGKQGGSGNRGWQLSHQATSAGVDQFEVFFYPSSGSSAINLFRTKMTTALSSTDFHHVVATYSSTGANSGEVNIYVNGIAQALEFTNTTSTTATFTNTNLSTTAGVLNGSNGRPFEIGHRGESLTAGTTNEFTGLVDDYALDSSLYTPQYVALIHGLGRMAGVSYGDLNGLSTSTEILDVLAAYNGSTSALAGGKTWVYSPDLGQGGIVGTIGGSVAGNDAFIVLGANGSGMQLVPEPGSIGLVVIGMMGLGIFRRQAPKGRNS